MQYSPHGNTLHGCDVYVLCVLELTYIGTLTCYNFFILPYIKRSNGTGNQ